MAEHGEEVVLGLIGGLGGLLRRLQFGLGADPAKFDPVRGDEAGAGRQERFEVGDIGLGVAARPVGDPDHAHQGLAVIEGQAEECRQRRMARRQAPGARVVRWVVRDHRAAGRHDLADDGVDVVELDPPTDVRAVEGPARLVTRDVADRRGDQTGPTFGSLEQLGDEAIGAASQPEQVIEERIEDRAKVGLGDEVEVGTVDRLDQPARRERDGLGLAAAGQVEHEADVRRPLAIERRGPEQNRHPRAVLADILLLERRAGARRREFGQGAVVERSRFRRGHRVPADQPHAEVVACVADKGEEGIVRVGQRAVGVRDGDADQVRLEEPAIPRLAPPQRLFRPLAIGHVERRGDDRDDPPARVVEHGAMPLTHQLATTRVIRCHDPIHWSPSADQLADPSRRLDTRRLRDEIEHVAAPLGLGPSKHLGGAAVPVDDPPLGAPDDDPERTINVDVLIFLLAGAKPLLGLPTTAHIAPREGRDTGHGRRGEHGEISEAIPTPAQFGRGLGVRSADRHDRCPGAVEQQVERLAIRATPRDEVGCPHAG